MSDRSKETLFILIWLMAGWTVLIFAAGIWR